MKRRPSSADAAPVPPVSAPPPAQSVPLFSAADAARLRIKTYERAVASIRRPDSAILETFANNFLWDLEESDAQYKLSAAKYREAGEFVFEDGFCEDFSRRLENHAQNCLRGICSHHPLSDDDFDALRILFSLPNSVHCNECYLKSVDPDDTIRYTYREAWEPSEEVELRNRVFLALKSFVVEGVRLAGEYKQELLRRDFLFVFEKLERLIHGCITDDGLPEDEIAATLSHLHDGIVFLWAEAQFHPAYVNVDALCGLTPAAPPDAPPPPPPPPPSDAFELGDWARRFVTRCVPETHTVVIRDVEPFVIATKDDTIIWRVLTALLQATDPEGWVEDLPDDWDASFKKDDPHLRKVFGKRVKNPDDPVNRIRCHIEPRLGQGEKGVSAYRLVETPDKTRLSALKSDYENALRRTQTK